MTMAGQGNPAASVHLEQQGNVLRVCLSGRWCIDGAAPSMERLLLQLAAGNTQRVVFDVAALQDWDSLLASTLLQVQRVCESYGIDVDLAGLPQDLVALLALARAVAPESAPAPGMLGWWPSIAGIFSAGWQVTANALAFTGEILLGMQRLLRGQSTARAQDFWFFVGQAGPGALGIISLVSILAGVILAYLGTVQLKQFGAQVYVANLVSIGMTREMGALMTAIIMSGRTGAAYAAQLGTMQANEEVDALRVMGIDPVDFLVLPRLLALVLVLPFLTLYSDMLGILGGALIAGTMDIGITQYIVQTQASISLQEVADGLLKSLVFAWLIAQSGCYWGLQSGRSSNDVGIATTRAVVTALVAIIIADSVLNVLYDRLGI